MANADAFNSGFDAATGGKSKKTKKQPKDVKKITTDDGDTLYPSASVNSAVPKGFKKGGKVKKTQVALLHKNERVIPAKSRPKVERLMKRHRVKLTGKR